MKLLKPLGTILLAILTLTSCEKAETGQVKISIEPGVPVVSMYDYVDGSDTIAAPWFAYKLRFENSSDKDVVINTIEFSFRYADLTDFSAPEELDSADKTGSVFLTLDAGSSGLEYQYISGGTDFNRYIELILDEDRRFPRDFNFYFKLEAKGYFTEPGNANAPLNEFSKVVFFRTRGPDQ